MILQADAKSLEIYCAAYLSQDQIMLRELRDGLDMHGLNQEAFSLPSRLISKVLNFRILYGGSGYSFAHDPDFTSVSTSEKYWNAKIDAFYEKYQGLAIWHTSIVQQVTLTSQLVMPTGRIYQFQHDPKRGWPETTIKNYPVQGLGADLMSIARVSFFKRFKNADINGKLINTVHDSIVVDIHQDEVQRCVRLFDSVFADIPTNFSKLFGVEFNLPLRCECAVGHNMKQLEVVTA